MECSYETLHGTLTAICTPFSADGSQIDYPSLESLLRYQYDGGVRGIVACGSTGEAATLSDEEYKSLVKRVRSLCGPEVMCIAAIGTNNTAKAVEQAIFLRETKVDAILLVAPPYLKPTQGGIVAHFNAVKAASGLPIIAYNVPGRTGCSIAAQTVSSLFAQKTIVGIKESSGSLEQAIDIAAGCDVSRFVLLSGEDALVHAVMASGGRGVISASANSAPKGFVTMTNAWLRGDVAGSLKAQIALLPLIRAFFLESNPIPVKTALALQGVIKHATLRLPLMPASESTVVRLRELIS